MNESTKEHTQRLPSTPPNLLLGLPSGNLTFLAPPAPVKGDPFALLGDPIVA